MSMEFGDLAAQIAGEVRITPLEIADLRGVGWADGQMTPDQAEFLFVANETGGDAGPEWCDFFVEALTSYVVHTVLPRGYVDAEMAELELLVRVIEVASSVPEVLRTYALQQFEEAVAMGDGPTRHGELDRCGINQTEVKLLRRLIFGTGSERPGGVGKAEAELLFRIKDATLYEVNCLE